MPSPRLDEIATTIAEHHLHTVELATVDTYGHLRGKRVPAQRFARTVAEHGAHIADAIFVFDVQCEIVDSPLINMNTGFLDMHLEPDLATFRVMPHRPGYATVMSRAFASDGAPHPLDPRAVLQSQIDRVRGLGYDAVVATELECYVCLDDWSPIQPHVQYSSLMDAWPLERCVQEMRQAMLDLDIPVESSNPEYGPGQLEINVSCDDPMRTADNTVLFKMVVKEIARRHGLRATFMPKPFAGQSGSGMHVHTSLSVDGRNVFDAGDDHPLDDVFRQWVGGLVRHAPAMSLIGIPTGNGYKRVREYTFCPTHVHWGGDNRTVLCRCTTGQGQANRVEFRSAGATRTCTPRSPCSPPVPTASSGNSTPARSVWATSTPSPATRSRLPPPSPPASPRSRAASSPVLGEAFSTTSWRSPATSSPCTRRTRRVTPTT
ncbi:MAG: glutamine synthetase family protein [Ilumatobacteraceae bacterium]